MLKGPQFAIWWIGQLVTVYLDVTHTFVILRYFTSPIIVNNYTPLCRYTESIPPPPQVLDSYVQNISKYKNAVFIQTFRNVFFFELIKPCNSVFQLCLMYYQSTR